jgi:hypothetical protein
MAVDVIEVDSNRVIAGGVTMANLPHDFRNLRRSSSSADASSELLFVTVIFCSPSKSLEPPIAPRSHLSAASFKQISVGFCKNGLLSFQALFQ